MQKSSVSNTGDKPKIEQCSSYDPLAGSEPRKRLEIQNFYKNDKEMKKDNQPSTGSGLLPVDGEKTKRNTDESLLHKNLRLSSTEPIQIAFQKGEDIREKIDISTIQFTKGLSLKGKEISVSKHGIEEAEKQIKEAENEFEASQKKLACLENAELQLLFANFLRCKADPILEKYGPEAEHTPTAEHIKIELRRAIADATLEAQRRVFKNYITDDRLEFFVRSYNAYKTHGWDPTIKTAMKDSAKHISHAQNALQKTKDALQQQTQTPKKKASTRTSASSFRTSSGSAKRDDGAVKVNGFVAPIGSY